MQCCQFSRYQFIYCFLGFKSRWFWKNTTLMVTENRDASLAPIGLIEYSEGTLSVLMLCLMGLFNSANGHENARVSPAAESADHCWHSLWWGSVPSADLCKLTMALSPGSCPTGGWTPVLHMHTAHCSCQFMLMPFWISNEKQLIFWVGCRGGFTSSLITTMCHGTCWLRGLWGKTWTEFKECPVEVISYLHDQSQCQDEPLSFNVLSNNCVIYSKLLIVASN